MSRSSYTPSVSLAGPMTLGRRRGEKRRKEGWRSRARRGEGRMERRGIGEEGMEVRGEEKRTSRCSVK